MKKLNIYQFSFILLAVLAMPGCYKLQKDYQYHAYTLDPNINMTAKDFMNSRGKAGVAADTIFKLMQLGIEYAGIDMAEYEKTGRTFIFLHNNSIRTTTGTGAATKVTGGFFFDYPVVGKDASGNVLKSVIDPTQDSLRAAFQWNEYPQQFVKNYFLYLILQGEYSFENLGVTNTSIQTLLPPGTVAARGDSKLSWVVTKTTPNPDPASATLITFIPNGGGTGFDPEGKMNLTLRSVSGSPQDAPLTVNDRVPDRSAGYFATNGKIHVFDKTIPPFRYSYP